MASNRQLASLFQAIARGDLEGAVARAREIIESTERQGHRSASRLLRGSLNPNGAVAGVSGVAITNDTLGLLIEEVSEGGLGDVRLGSEARAELNDLMLEFKHEVELIKNDISRRRTVLFSGPPGCGKSMTARALGRELDLPVYTARLSAVVGAYLGQTGARLHQLFRWAESNCAVLLLDEIDSLGQSRGRMEDVGELDRVVISLLQELDHSRPAGITIAATNRPESLDEALLRRFDLHLEFPAPSTSELMSFLRDRARRHGLRLSRAEQRMASSSGTFAGVDAELESMRRKKVLDGLRGGI